MGGTERIAIVGYAARLPGSGADPDDFWTRVLAAADCSSPVPEGRWLLPPDRCIDPRVPHPDSVYSNRGYYLDPFTPNLEGLAVSSDWLTGLDPLFQLILDVGHRAWRSAPTDSVDRRRAGVILGNICLPTDASSRLAREILGDSGEQTNPLNRYVAGLPAGVLAKALGLGGGTFTLDAACASSLYAVKLACDELLSKRADLMLAGGANRSDCQYTQMGFAQLRALSQSGRCSPFDRLADGLMVGEGAVIFALKRLSDAVLQGDKIHGVICGIGLSNDMHGNLLAPAKEGQLRAMRAAYDQAGWSPHQVDLVECHATGTAVGDAVEFSSLRELWGTKDWTPHGTVIGSVKSTVGHLLTGAGGAALLKVVLALNNHYLPPQANFETPNETLDYENGPFQVLRESQPWTPKSANLSRRAAVSGFGFGGVNAHLLVEEYIGQKYLSLRPSTTPIKPVQLTTVVSKAPTTNQVEAPEPIAIVGLSAHFGPCVGLRPFQEYVFGGPGSRPPAPRQNGWGLANKSCPPGHFIDTLTIPLDRFRIPPKEIEEMLPQQSLMLMVAAAALDDCQSAKPDGDDPRAGVFIGLGLDLNTTNFHLRWAALAAGEAEPDAISPPLNADRTMGALGSIAASRIARAFHFGGPSFTVCSEESSSGRAVELAIRALRSREIDRAVVGGVDLAGDPRALLATGRSATHGVDGEGAAALVLKRLADAERDGDRIYAVLKGVGCASGGAVDGVAPDAAAYASSLVRACSDGQIDPATIDYIEGIATGSAEDEQPEYEALAALLKAQNRSFPLAVGAVRHQVGRVGAAGAAAGLVKAALALYQQILPPTPVEPTRADYGLPLNRWHHAEGPRFWLANAGQPRRAAVASTGVDGSVVHLILEEYPGGWLESQPTGARQEAVFALDAQEPTALVVELDRFDEWLGSRLDRPIEYLAREWFAHRKPSPMARRAVAMVARTSTELREQILAAREAIRSRPQSPMPDPKTPDRRPAIRDRVFYSPDPLGAKGKVAFVFPGSGNHFAGMGRDLSAAWPDVLRQQQAENKRLRDQYAPDRFWQESIPEGTSPRQFLFGQVTLGTLTADLFTRLGIRADAMVGQSLGESAGLFGLQVWRDRDEMLQRIETSSLFGSDLAPPYQAARIFWGMPAGSEVDWVTGVLTVPADDVRVSLRPGLKAYLLIVTTPTECVIGGIRSDVLKLVSRFNAAFFPLTGVTLAHCEVGRPVEGAYRDLHTLPTTPPAGLTIYSGAWGKSYKPTSENCADSITGGLIDTIDVPAVVEAAYRDGVRFFLEVGPGNSTTRMIAAILADRPHLARAVCVPRQDSVSLVLRLVANLVAERGPVDLAKLYGGPSPCVDHQPPAPAPRLTLTLPVGQPPRPAPPPPPEPEPVVVAEVPPPPPPVREEPPAPEPAPIQAVEPSPPEEFGDDEDDLPAMHGVIDIPPAVTPMPKPTPAPVAPSLPPLPAVPTLPRTRVVAMPAAVSVSTGVDWAVGMTPFVAAAAQTQSANADAHEAFLRVQSGFSRTAEVALQLQTGIVSRLLGHDDDDSVPTEVPRSLNTEQCFEFARGSIGKVLGSLFAEADSFPTRVRLPDGPLMLVDNIRLIEGDPRSMTRGRVVTDHHVHSDRWYLDSGRIPTCVAVEAGQADLFLSGFLGIDFQTRGEAVYRLLDAVVTFYRALPQIGETIVYDIHVDEFFHQSDTWLFRFRFEATVNGERLMSMQNGVAGFFTPEALASGKGIVHTKFSLQQMPGKRPADWRELVPMASCQLGAPEVQALRRGDLAGAFGPLFAGLPLQRPMALPGGMLRLLDAVPVLDPTGGRFGIGFVRAEYAIDPNDWFLTCHFVDDMVMPGTLMYECCLHTLRVYLMRMGWVGEDGQVACEPVPGISSRLKCRGQVIASTRVVAYEVTVKELGYGPEPFCIADALMYADGKPIVEITNMSLRMSGLTREALEATWANPAPIEKPKPARKPALYDKAKIMAYSNGNPSEGFGEPYRIFDEGQGRVIARLPGPPFQFVDRITAVTGDPFVLKAGAACEAEYEVPADAWYFTENRSTRMPFSVLLEIALQPCGWLAAYCGSALTSDSDLSFRNLGGKAIQHLPVTPDIGLLTIQVRMSNVSKSAGMIIQHYDMKVLSSEGVVYEGTTYFGFFGKEALANQVGMPTAKVPFLTPEQWEESTRDELPHEAPFPAPMMRMVDRIDGYLPTGGAKGLGLVQGRIAVDPGFWFFQAHFYQDPVWPGSLGLESFLQLLKYVAWKRWGNPGPGGWQTVALEHKHEWVYRGQVIPKDHEVIVVLEVTAVDDAQRRLTANGFLTVDGRIIYQMLGFTLE